MKKKKKKKMMMMMRMTKIKRMTKKMMMLMLMMMKLMKLMMKSERPAMVGRDRVPVNAGAPVERMVELHVECSELFTDWRKATTFGENVSVRYPLDLKPIIVHGQDEAVHDSSSSSKLYVRKLHALFFC